jgi:hypothetical protein
MVMTPLMRLRERVKARKVKARKARIRVKVRMLKTPRKGTTSSPRRN